MSPISGDIYLFTKDFLKLKRQKMTFRDFFALLMLICGMLAYTGLIETVFQKKWLYAGIYLVVLSLSVITNTLYFQNNAKESKSKNFIDIHSKQYIEFRNLFEKKYSVSYGSNLRNFLQLAVNDLKSDIETQVEKNKYKFDKVVMILTLSPLLSALGLVKWSNSLQLNSDTIAVIIVGVGILLFIVNSWVEHIFYPSFNWYGDLRQKQNVYAFLNGYLLAKIDELSIENRKEGNVIEEEKIDNSNKSFKKYRLFYKYKTDYQLVMTVLWGVYSYERDSKRIKIKILWGLVELNLPSKKLEKEEK